MASSWTFLPLLYIALALLQLQLASQSPIFSQSTSVSNSRPTLIGATDSKEFYLVNEAYPDDFQWAQFKCINVWELQPAEITTEKEFSILDNYLTTKYENSSFGESVELWTSGSTGFSQSHPEWYTGGQIALEVHGRWPGGAGSSPSYLWYKCVTIQRTCFSTFPGGACYIATRLWWSDCRIQKQYLCQKDISNKE